MGHEINKKDYRENGTMQKNEVVKRNSLLGVLGFVSSFRDGSKNHVFALS